MFGGSASVEGDPGAARYVLDLDVFEDVYRRAQQRHLKSIFPTTGYEKPPKRIPRRVKPAKTEGTADPKQP